MAIPVGSKAPDFTLKSKQASGLVDVKLGDNFGKKNIVLLFFPLAFTSVCTKEMCDLTAGLNAYAGITLASDLNKEVAKKYDVMLQMLAGIGDASARAAFVIDKNGVVQYSEQTSTPKDLPNFEAIKAVLAKLK
jgi:peroxiredoxin